jgi:hypothetical protein
MNKKIILGFVFLIYFFLIIIYSLKVIANYASQKRTYISKVISENHLKKIDHCLSAVLLQKESKSHNNYLDLYMAATGSNSGFGHFAYVEPVYKLSFELEFNDGTRQVVLPHVGTTEIGARLNNLLSLIVTTQDGLLKDVLIKRLAENELKNYTGVKMIHVIIGVIDIPTLDDFVNKASFNYKYLYQYNFIPAQQ